MSQLPLPHSRDGATRRARTCGFTLLELLTVIAIVAVLTSIVIGVGRRASESGKIARTKAELAAIATGLEGYKRQYGSYPQTADATRLLQALVGKLGPTGVAMNARALIEAAKFTTANGVDPFVSPLAVLIDPWDQPYVYVYRVPATGWTNSSFVLYSIGPDGKDSPQLLAGGIIDPTPQENADNLYANRP